MLMLYLTSTSITSLTLPDCLSHKEEIHGYLVQKRKYTERSHTQKKKYKDTGRTKRRYTDTRSIKKEIHRYLTQKEEDAQT